MDEILIGTIDSGDSLPSAYELFLLDQIDRMLRPACHHLVRSASGALPRSVSGVLLDQWESLFVCLQLAWQWSQIRTHDRSIAESIYGLRRVNLPREAQSNLEAARPLSGLQQDASIAIVAILPPLLAALDKLSARMRRRRAERLAAAAAAATAAANAVNTASVVSTANAATIATAAPEAARSALLLPSPWDLMSRAWPFIHGAYDGAVVLQRLAYLFRFTPYSHPLLMLLEIAVVRNHHQLPKQQTTAGGPPVIDGRAASKMAPILDSATVKVGLLLVVLLAAHVSSAAAEGREEGAEAGDGQLDTGGASSSRGPSNGVAVPYPAPPPVCRGGLVPSAGLCPSCRKDPSHPSVSSGGFVFCYNCLAQHVRDSGRCPVSGVPCRMDQIVRLYIGDAGLEAST